MPIKTNSTNSSGENNKTARFLISEAKYQFSDLILPNSTLAELNKVIGLKRYQQEVFQDWGLSQTHKFENKIIINLYGKPGTGKTMAAHAIANELGRKLIIINYAEIESKYVGETPKNIQSAFEYAKEQNAILFFDEADAILSRRVTNMSSATDTSVNQTRSVMLNLLNEYNDTILFATNFISNYDPAFMRRILMHIEFHLPDLETRKRLFKHYIPNELPHSIDIDEISGKSEGLSGADIANAILLAAFSAKVENENKVSNANLFSQIEVIQQSRLANEGILKVETKEVSEEYVKQNYRGIK